MADEVRESGQKRFVILLILLSFNVIAFIFNFAALSRKQVIKYDGKDLTEAFQVINNSITDESEKRIFQDFSKNMTDIYKNWWNTKHLRYFWHQRNLTQFQLNQLKLWSLLEEIFESSSQTIDDGLHYCKDQQIFDSPGIDIFDHLKKLHLSSHALHQNLQEFSISAKNITETLQESLLELNKTESDKNVTSGWWTGVVGEIGTLTDKLHKGRKREFEQIVKDHGSDLETVVKIDDSDEKGTVNGDEEKTPLSIMDSKSNLFTLTHPSGIKSLSVHGEDPSLIADILLVIVVGFTLGALFEVAGLPAFFGYLLTGLILGPSGFDTIKNVIQVSSIGQIGALLLLLSLGLEFSFDKLAEFYKITVLGTTGLTLSISLLCGLIGKLLLKNSFVESSFAGIIISFSSTAVSMKCMSLLSSKQVLSGIDKIVSGVLIMQDIIFCLLVSLLPLLSSATQNESTASLIVSIFMFTLKTAILVACLFLWCRYLAPKFYSQLRNRIKTKEEVLTGSVTLLSAFGGALLGHYFGLSNEFGVFMVGFLFATYPLNAPVNLKESNEEISNLFGMHENLLIRNLSDLFAVFFFVSVGLFIDIWFIKGELAILFMSSALFITLKFALMYGGLRSISTLEPVQVALVSLNLSQISELSMVLGSKARRLGILSNEVYFILVASTSICLIAVPIIWKLMISNIKPYESPSEMRELNETEV